MQKNNLKSKDKKQQTQKKEKKTLGVCVKENSAGTNQVGEAQPLSKIIETEVC